MEIKINQENFVKKVFLVLFTCEVLIVLADIFLNHYHWIPYRPMRRMVNIAREDSIGTWFMTTQMFIMSVILLFIYLKKRFEKEKLFWGWLVLCLFYFYMGIDDAIKFHERVGSAFKLFLGSDNLKEGETVLRSFWGSYSWQVVFLPFFGSMGIFIMWFLKSRLGSMKLFKYVLAALTCYVLAVGLDFVEGLDNNGHKEIAQFFGTKTAAIRHFSKVIEEFLEIFGTTLFLVCYLKYFLSISKSYKIEIK